MYLFWSSSETFVPGVRPVQPSCMRGHPQQCMMALGLLRASALLGPAPVPSRGRRGHPQPKRPRGHPQRARDGSAWGGSTTGAGPPSAPRWSRISDQAPSTKPQGVWLGTISGLGTPDTTGKALWASFRRTYEFGPGLGFFRRPGPAPYVSRVCLVFFARLCRALSILSATRRIARQCAFSPLSPSALNFSKYL
jgi:hypothetical protein